MAEDRIAQWVAEKLKENHDLTTAGLSDGGLLIVNRSDQKPFIVAALSEQEMVTEQHVVPFFQKSEKPDFVVNVPSKAIWSGPAIDLVHNVPAAFGGMGDLGRAARLDDVSSYRFRNYEFVETGIRQHSAVSQVERLFDRKFLAHRWDGPDFTIALVDTYMMSAEDIRHVRDRYGTFDVALKMTSYGGITSAAHDAAASMGAEACMWGDLMRRLARN